MRNGISYCYSFGNIYWPLLLIKTKVCNSLFQYYPKIKMTMLIFLSVLMCINILNGETQSTDNNTSDVEGYYWRDFRGDIPSDAFPGGQDLHGNPIYIGQIYALYLIPAKIYSTDKKIYYEYGGFEHSAKSNIKILCTKHPEQFEWIQTSTKDISSLASRNLVIGGYEPGCTTYIGRTRFDGEIMVGKALADNLLSIFAGLYVTNNGRGKHFKSYEVLAFNDARSSTTSSAVPFSLPTTSSSSPPLPTTASPSSSSTTETFLENIDIRFNN